MLLHQLFEARLRRSPDALALELPPGPDRPRRIGLSYAELWAWSGAMAADLGGSLAADACVAILLPREAPALYAAQLAILRAGGAFLSLDPEAPDAQLARLLADARPAALLTDAPGAERIERLAHPVAMLKVLGPEPGPLAEPTPEGRNPGQPSHRPARVSDPPEADRRLAYLIYTSGSTGIPKGVMIEHRGIVNLVRSDLSHFDLGPGDRVAQVSSPIYDSSIEEAWLAFASGATLVLLDAPTLRLGPDLPEWLRRERISVLCPPPTLLRSMACADPAAALPDLRLLYVGGEPLPPDLADAWARGRRMVNGYGPTECSVTVLRAEVEPGRPVRIGCPVDGNRAWILDAALEPLPEGEAGELCIGGPCLARGYLGQPEESAARFVEHPRLGRLYRSGDLARLGPEGFEHLGRIDDQVKLRGHRIELGAVEAALAALPGLRAAACRIQGPPSRPLLAAHLVAENPAAPPAIAELRAALRERLPEPMRPARYAFLPALPTTLGGKLDRRALPEIGLEAEATVQRAGSEDRDADVEAHDGSDPATRSEAPSIEAALRRRIAEAFAEALGLEAPAAVDADFFVDLGGDSLGAVAVILALRESATLRDAVAGMGARATVRDLYGAPSAAGLARRLAASLEGPGPGVQPDRAAPRGGPAGVPVPASDARIDDAQAPVADRAGLVTLLQLIWLAIALLPAAGITWFVAGWLLPAVLNRFGLAGGLLALSAASAGARLLWLPIALGLTCLAKALLVGRYEAGAVPAWSLAHARHWMVAQTARLLPWGLIAGSPLAPMALRALSARVGGGVHIHRGAAPSQGGWDLLTIGDGATLARDAELRLVELDAGRLVYDRIEVGAGATLDPRAGMSPGARLGAAARLDALSWLPGGTWAGAGERWSGVPAEPRGDARPLPEPMDRALAPALQATLLLSGRLLLEQLPWIGLALALQLAELAWPGRGPALRAWLASPAAGGIRLAWLLGLPALGLALGLILQALSVRALGPIAVGCYALDGLTAIRAQLQAERVEAAGRWLSGSMLWPWWLRAAGMRIGPGSEISSIHEVVPGRVRIGADCFFADGVYLCPPELRGGRMRVADTRIGDRTFLGNHALVPAGADWPDGLFVGVATPADARRAGRDSSWFGHPPMRLPRREVVEVDRRLTHAPDPLRRATRAFWETLRFLLPGLPAAVAALWYAAAFQAASSMRPLGFLAFALPALTALALLLPCLATLALKWLLLGRVKPGRHGFWSCWCGRWDFVYMAWTAWARGSLASLEGSLALNACLRLTGMRIGRLVLLGRGFAQVVDPDMLCFEDRATVEGQFQAHSFEDRVLKIDRLRIGAGATVGAQTVLFYGAEIGAGAKIAPQGVVMKHDRIAPGSRHAGTPIRPLD